ncbi:MAG TPA: hypothetical protein PKH07_13900, partial [bacterium]|nr:hypothetical protein [bacterium]
RFVSADAQATPVLDCERNRLLWSQEPTGCLAGRDVTKADLHHGLSICGQILNPLNRPTGSAYSQRDT